MSRDTHKRSPHNWNVICDVCGKKKKRSECEMSVGSGLIPVVMSCKDGCYDKLQPLNYPPPVIFDGRPVPDARPDQGINKETYITVTLPSFMTWGKLKEAPKWGSFHLPNTIFNLEGQWTWGFFNAGT